MIEMTFELAEKIAKAAHKKSKELNRPMSVSIVDESGRMVYFSRADGAGFYPDINMVWKQDMIEADYVPTKSELRHLSKTVAITDKQFTASL